MLHTKRILESVNHMCVRYVKFLCNQDFFTQNKILIYTQLQSTGSILVRAHAHAKRLVE